MLPALLATTLCVLMGALKLERRAELMERHIMLVPRS